MQEHNEALSFVFDLKYSCVDFDDDNVVHDYIGKFEVSYDGELLGIDRWEAAAGEDLSKYPTEGLTFIGADQAKQLAATILALLKVKDGIDVFDGEDFQKEYARLVSAAQDTHNKETTEDDNQ